MGDGDAPMSAAGAKRPERETEVIHVQATWMSAAGAKRPGRPTEITHVQATWLNAWIAAGSRGSSRLGR